MKPAAIEAALFGGNVMSTNLVPRTSNGVLLKQALAQPLVDSDGDTFRYAEFNDGKERLVLIEATGQPSRDVASKMQSITHASDKAMTVNGPVRVLVTTKENVPWVFYVQALTTVVGLITLVFVVTKLCGN
jgi:hypothetical protein